ncbi:alpha-L-fucosidase [Draconibacterium orientale]|uniref:alpha-L-fucosidase n=1 Tax=Draconibacterium orientale TaxID=1168034 RepID=UPI002A0A5DDD|nr:alpha-L-fucosidase [Draconibacterium orientale]
MSRITLYSFILLSFIISSSCSKTEAPAAYGPIPSENQMRWQEMEYYAFVHFSLNTYTDQSWGFGDEDVKLFNPEKLNTRQWARICKEAGVKGIIVTAKHHCGFCLWPTETTEYSVKNAPWKDGKGDVIRELADACKEYGLKLGIYVSPWDRNHPDYGKPEYINVFRNQIKEVLTNYGDVFEIWFDGANGGTGYYGGANEHRKIDRTTYYDWQPTYKLIRELQPNIVIWNDGGDRGDLRWVGTEAGFIGETNWSLLNSTGEVPFEMLHHGVENGNTWVPGEVNTSIRPEWFYHPSEDTKVKTLPQLMETYYHSIGRNATLLLNFPIRPNGLIDERDEKAALDFAEAVKEVCDENLIVNAKAEATNIRGNSRKYEAAKTIDADKNTYWATDDEVKTASLTIDFDEPKTFNRFLVQEYIRLGQRVKAFTIEALVGGEWKELDKQTTIGYKRILRFPTVTATKLRFNITESKACPLISNIGVYNAPQVLTPPKVIREQSGNVKIIPADQESEIYYTLDGSDPTSGSIKYTLPIQTGDGKVEVRAIAYDPSNGKSSQVSGERFDIARKTWRILSTDDIKAYAIIDGDIASAWNQPRDKKIPADLIIDMGKEEKLTGFKYQPNQSPWGPGIITNYQFSVSQNGKKWLLVSEGEFSNIKNNPLWQTKNFEPVIARYFKFSALKNTEGTNNVGYGEVDVITQ